MTGNRIRNFFAGKFGKEGRNGQASSESSKSASKRKYTVADDLLSAEARAALEAAEVEVENAPKRWFYDFYETDELIGRGAFARIFKCRKRVDGSVYAVKVISGEPGEEEEQKQAMIKKIAIMRMLQSHPQMLKLYELFKDDEGYFVVVEFCPRGALFEQIINKGHFSEREAAFTMQQLFDFLQFSHAKGIMHRDLKPENLLVTDGGDLKVIDFGTADFCADGQRLHVKFGTPHYVAPEVLAKDYDKSADIWSAGCILYILLSGYTPFRGRTDTCVLDRVRSGTWQFDKDCWRNVTTEAKDLIQHMIVINAKHRLTASQVLEHRWFEASLATESMPLGEELIGRLREFTTYARLKQLGLKMMARSVTMGDVKRLLNMFRAMDKGRTGVIDSTYLYQALERIGAAVDEQMLEELLEANPLIESLDHKIDYEEFLGAMIESDRFVSRDAAVRDSFDMLDYDHDGFISLNDLQHAMPRASLDLCREVLDEVDEEHTGHIDFNQYQKVMNMKATPNPSRLSSLNPGSSLELTPSTSDVANGAVQAAAPEAGQNGVGISKGAEVAGSATQNGGSIKGAGAEAATGVMQVTAHASVT